MFGLYFVTWENDFQQLIDTFDNYDEADNARLVRESRMSDEERMDGYYLVAEV